MIMSPDAVSDAFCDFARQSHPPVIMQVVPALNSGGVEQGVIDLNASIVKAGGRSIVVSSGGTRAREITKAGGTHITLPVHSKNPLTIASNIAKLRKVIRTNNVDIVHACSRAPAWSAGRAVQGTSARYVTSVHSAHKISGALKRLYNSSITKGERVIAVSHFLADYLEKNYQINSANIRVVHRGVALEKFHPNSVTPDRLIKVARQWRVPDGALVIMLPARLSRSKGHMFLIDALQPLKQKDFFCLFVGSDTVLGWPGRGFLTITIAHITFSLAFVAVVVQARLADFDRALEEAAMDLGATPWVTFLTVTLPIIAPSVASGWLLAFTLSLDDLILTQFVAGAQSETLPMSVYSSVRLGVDPQINALATIVVAVAASALVLSGWLTRRRA